MKFDAVADESQGFFPGLILVDVGLMLVIYQIS